MALTPRAPGLAPRKDDDDQEGAGPWLRRQVVAAVMNLIVVVVLIAALAYNLGWSWQAWIHRIGPLTLFAIWALSFLPGWLFVRFLGQRAGALRREFVIYLHRLGVDEPQYLPKPPLDSGYYRQWLQAGGDRQPKTKAGGTIRRSSTPTSASPSRRSRPRGPGGW